MSKQGRDNETSGPQRKPKRRKLSEEPQGALAAGEPVSQGRPLSGGRRGGRGERSTAAAQLQTSGGNRGHASRPGPSHHRSDLAEHPDNPDHSDSGTAGSAGHDATPEEASPPPGPSGRTRTSAMQPAGDVLRVFAGLIADGTMEPAAAQKLAVHLANELIASSEKGLQPARIHKSVSSAASYQALAELLAAMSSQPPADVAEALTCLAGGPGGPLDGAYVSPAAASALNAPDVRAAAVSLSAHLMVQPKWEIAPQRTLKRAKDRHSYKLAVGAAGADGGRGGELRPIFCSVFDGMERRGARGAAAVCQTPGGSGASGRPAGRAALPESLIQPGSWRKVEQQMRRVQEATEHAAEVNQRACLDRLLALVVTESVRDAHRSYPLGCLLRGASPPLEPVAVAAASAPGEPATRPTQPEPGCDAAGARRLQLLPLASGARGVCTTGGQIRSGGAAACVAEGLPGRFAGTGAASPLWTAGLSAAALTVRPSLAACAAVAGVLPSGMPLRVCRTAEAAAEAVDLTLMALRGAFGTPLNLGPGAYVGDLELLLPVRGSDLRARLAAVRHSLAGRACHGPGETVVSSALGGVGVVRVRFGCGACAACRDPLAPEPCLRPLTALCSNLALPDQGCRDRGPYARALREALGWDPVATYRKAADLAVRKRPRACLLEEVSGEEGAEAAAGAAAAAAAAEPKARRRRRVEAERGDAGAPGAEAVVEATHGSASPPSSSDDDRALWTRLPARRRQQGRSGQGAVRRLPSLFRRVFYVGAADGDVTTADRSEAADDYAFDGLLLDSDRLQQKSRKSLHFLSVTVESARAAELKLDEQEELKAALREVPAPPARDLRCGVVRRVRVSFGAEGLTPTSNAPAVAAGGGQRLPGFVGQKGPSVRTDRAFLAKMTLEQPQAYVQTAAVVKAAGLDMVALAARPHASGQRCPWCGLLGHFSPIHCPLRRLCAPPLDPLLAQRHQEKHQGGQRPQQAVRLPQHPQGEAGAGAGPPGQLMGDSLLPERQLLPPGLPRDAHHYSTLLGGGSLEPLLDEPSEWRTSGASLMPLATRRGKRQAAAAVLEAQLDVAGKLPAVGFDVPGGAAPPWLPLLESGTLELMAALNQAQPWATGLQPVRCIGAVDMGPGAGAGAGGGAGDADGSARAGGDTAAARWGVLPSPQPLSHEDLLLLALLVEESVRFELQVGASETV